MKMNTQHTHLWDTRKVVLKDKFIVSSTINKLVRFHTSEVTAHVKTLGEKRKQTAHNGKNFFPPLFLHGIHLWYSLMPEKYKMKYLQAKSHRMAFLLTEYGTNSKYGSDSLVQSQSI